MFDYNMIPLRSLLPVSLQPGHLNMAVLLQIFTSHLILSSRPCRSSIPGHYCTISLCKPDMRHEIKKYYSSTFTHALLVLCQSSESHRASVGSLLTWYHVEFGFICDWFTQ